MKLTGAAILVSRGMKVLQAAPAAYPFRPDRPRTVASLAHGPTLRESASPPDKEKGPPMKVIAGDFGENRDASLCKAWGWFGGGLDRIEITRWLRFSLVIKASEIKEVQVVADNSKIIPGDLSGTTAGAVAGLVIAGPIGLAIGALIGSAGNKKSSIDKSIAVLVRLTDGRQLLATCDLAEFGLLSAATPKKGESEKKSG